MRALLVIALCALPVLAAPKKGAKKAPAPVVDAGVPDAGVFVPPPEGKTDAAPVEKPKTRFFEGMGTPEQTEVLEELSRAIEEYEQESRDFKREVQLLVEKKYEEKRNTLANSYEKAIRDLEVLERRERLDAIAAFEEFLQRYPNDPATRPT